MSEVPLYASGMATAASSGKPWAAGREALGRGGDEVALHY